VRRAGAIVLLLVLMGCFGFAVNRYFAFHQKSEAATGPAPKPTQTKPQFTLPGTIYMAQAGAIYSLHGTAFTELTPQEGWTQPSLLPDGSGLLAVKETTHYFSDIYVLSTTGTVRQQVTHNGVPTPKDGNLSGNHWAFYPRLGPDSRLYVSYDSPKAGFQVDLSVWSSTLDGFGDRNAMTRITTPDPYTGGDVEALPLPDGGIIYAGYAYGGDGKAFSQIFYQSSPRRDGVALTDPKENCFQPSLSAQGTLAFVCSPSTTESDIQVATYDPDKHTLSNRHTVVSGGLAAAPSWSPDGTTLLYYAPASSGSGYFELWWLDRATTASPAPPRELTTQLDLDSTSAAVWSST
jgi:Tol biopolymer transport system component